MILIRRSSVRFDESHGRPKTAAGSTVSNRIVDRATAPRITTKNVHDDTVFQMSRLPEDCHQDQDKKVHFHTVFFKELALNAHRGVEFIPLRSIRLLACGRRCVPYVQCRSTARFNANVTPRIASVTSRHTPMRNLLRSSTRPRRQCVWRPLT
jgi:hypothetical protein